MNTSTLSNVPYKLNREDDTISPLIAYEYEIPKKLEVYFRKLAEIMLIDVELDFAGWKQDTFNRLMLEGDENAQRLGFKKIFHAISIDMVYHVKQFLDDVLSNDIEPFSVLLEKNDQNRASHTYLATLFKLTARLMGMFTRKIDTLGELSENCYKSEIFKKQASMLEQKRTMQVLTILIEHTTFYDVFSPELEDEGPDSLENFPIERTIRERGMEPYILDLSSFIRHELILGSGLAASNRFSEMFEVKEGQMPLMGLSETVSPFYKVKKQKKVSDLSRKMTNLFFCCKREIPSLLAVINEVFEGGVTLRNGRFETLAAYLLQAIHMNGKRSSDWVGFFKMKDYRARKRKIEARREERLTFELAVTALEMEAKDQEVLTQRLGEESQQVVERTRTRKQPVNARGGKTSRRRERR